MTTPVRIVLHALRAQPGPVYGLQLSEITGLGTGTIYPILHRMHAAGWLAATEESGPHPSRPGRRFYALTDQAPRS